MCRLGEESAPLWWLTNIDWSCSDCSDQTQSPTPILFPPHHGLLGNTNVHEQTKQRRKQPAFARAPKTDSDLPRTETRRSSYSNYYHLSCICSTTSKFELTHFRSKWSELDVRGVWLKRVNFTQGLAGKIPDGGNENPRTYPKAVTWKCEIWAWVLQ